MPQNPHARDFQNHEKTANLLGFDTIAAYDRWADSFENLLYWNKFLKEWLEPQRDKKSQTGNRIRNAQLKEVRKEIFYGNGGGKRTYSREIALLKTNGWNGKNWLAWLLFNLVDWNTADKDGIFFRKHMPLEEQEEKMWQHIQREM